MMKKIHLNFAFHLMILIDNYVDAGQFNFFLSKFFSVNYCFQ